MRRLLLDPDPRLRKVSEEVKAVDGVIKGIAQELRDFIKAKQATPDDLGATPLALAAPQLGILLRIFVIESPNLSLTAINPVVVKTKDDHHVWESCVSIPGRRFLVVRPKIVKFRFLDLAGCERVAKFHDVFAQVVMHEIDHLRGILLPDIARHQITTRRP